MPSRPPRPATRRSPETRLTIAVAIAWLALFGALILALGWHPYLGWLIAGTVVTALAFAFDKVQAKRAGRRVPERLLLRLARAGGPFGASVGMLGLRHKTRHTRFWVVQWLRAPSTPPSRSG